MVLGLLRMRTHSHQSSRSIERAPRLERFEVRSSPGDVRQSLVDASHATEAALRADGACPAMIEAIASESAEVGVVLDGVRCSSPASRSALAHDA